jgi:hypothetical protein
MLGPKMRLRLTSALVAIDLAHAMVWSECGYRCLLSSPRGRSMHASIKEALGTNSFDASADIWSAISLGMWPEHGAA